MVSVDRPEEGRAPAVRGLALPGLLVELMARGRWRHPGDAALRVIVPWLEEPLDFLTGVTEIRSESRSLDLLTDDAATARMFRQVRGSALGEPVELPWLDVELAVLIAVNRVPGADLAIALDYRTRAEDPRLVASDFWTDPRRCAWRTVTPSFSEFAAVLGHLRSS